MSVDAPVHALPRPYLVWLGGFTVARFGDAVLAFALGWAASGLGGTTAALVLTLHGLPRLVLLVVGGAVADRVGARRLLLGGEAALLVATVLLATTLERYGPATWVLLASSVTLGALTALCLPASGSMPRRLVPDEQLPRALALRQGVGQVVLMGAAPLGGVLVGAAGPAVVAWGAAVLLGASLGALLAVRELPGPSPAVTAGAPRLGLAEGWRVVVATPALRRALPLAGAGAALALPVPSLLVPLVGRASGWGPGSTGVVAGAVGVGAIGAALHAARRRAPAGAGTVAPAASGLAVSAVGAALLTLAATAHGSGLGSVFGVVVAVAGGVMSGVGNGMFAARLAPVLLGAAPRTHLARVQALVSLAQLVPAVVTTTALGALAEHAAPGVALGVVAAGLASCAAWARRPSTP